MGIEGSPKEYGFRGSREDLEGDRLFKYRIRNQTLIIMPIPEPKGSENQQEFISRCMSDLSEEFPDQEQRLAVCYAKWRE